MKTQDIELKLISPWENNPRKHFDKKYIQDLANSIKAQGLIQPIAIRPKGKKFLIVAGECRYRAAELAELKTISCIVRELDDKQALEIAIVENLQRENPHPLDEAEGFAAMKREGFTTLELSKKFSVSESVVERRIKLLELVPAIRKLFYTNKIQFGHALLICRLTKEHQKEALEYLEDEENDGDFPGINSLRDYIERNIYMELDKAPFDVKDESLIKKCGSCLVCPKRSGGNKLLFNDLQEDDTCLDRNCFEAKTDAALMINYNKAIEKGQLIVSSRWTVEPETKKAFPGVLSRQDYKSSSAKNGGVKALIVDGNEKGKYIFAELPKATKSTSVAGVAAPKKVQIAELEKKIEKDKELAEARLYNALTAKFKEIKIDTILGLDLSTEFGKLFLLFLLDRGTHCIDDTIYGNVKGFKFDEDGMIDDPNHYGWMDMDSDQEQKFLDDLMRDPSKLVPVIADIFVKDTLSRHGNYKQSTVIGRYLVNRLIKMFGAEFNYQEIVKEFEASSKKTEEKNLKKLQELKDGSGAKKKVIKKAPAAMS